MGATIRFSTSAGSAPGQATMTSTIGTRICGSSSRGVARRARAPRPREAAMKSGVSLLSRKAWATRPANPTRHVYRVSFTGAPSTRPGGIEDDALAGLDAGPDLDRVAVAGAGGHPAQAGLPLADHEEAGEAAPFEERRGGDGDAGIGGHARDQQAREEPRAQARRGGQIRLQLEPVRGGVSRGGDGDDGGGERGGLAVHHAPSASTPAAGWRRSRTRRWPAARGLPRLRSRSGACRDSRRHRD